jgi:hypothetical protein
VPAWQLLLRKASSCLIFCLCAPLLLQAALSFAESWATLVARGRFQFVPERFEAIMAAVLSHPLTDAQLKQALAIPTLLPVEARLGVRSWGWEP